MKKSKAVLPEYPKVYETFNSFACNVYFMDEPSAVNGVNVERYRITVDKIKEPTEVIHGRLINLWEHCDNHHQWLPLENKAKEYGLKLDPVTRGCKVKRK